MVGRLTDFVLVFLSIFLLIPSGLVCLGSALVLKSHLGESVALLVFILSSIGEIFLILAGASLWFVIKRARHPHTRKVASKAVRQQGDNRNVADVFTPKLPSSAREWLLTPLETSRKTKVRPKRNRKAPKRIRVWPKSLLGEINKDEKYFLYVYALSIVLGLVYGLFDNSIGKAAAAKFASMPPDTPFAIFSHNFLLNVVSTLTGGIGGLVVNFITYAAISGMVELAVSHSLPVARSHPVLSFEIVALDLISVFMVWLLELCAGMCFAISGFSFIERLWKRRTKLRRIRLLLLGTILLFIGAVLEWAAIAFMS
jgi:hypothetical protein